MKKQQELAKGFKMHNELILFDGGINNLIAPHLIPDNTGPYVANANIETGSLVSEKEPEKDTSITVNGPYATYFKAQDEFVSSEEDRFYVEWAGFLYWSNYVGDGSGKIQRYDGSTIVDIGGHIAPTAAPAAATNGSGLLDGDYSYTYTFIYDDVFETAPSPIQTVTGVSNNIVQVSNIPTTGFNPAPSHVVIYRSGGLNPTFNKVDRIPYGTSSYDDNTSDFKISRKELNTGTNDTPPADIDMLVESKGTLFGSVGDKIHFSKEGQPEYWSDYNYIQLPTECKGLAVLGDYVIAFTEENMFAITGRNIQDVQVNKLPFRYGCAHKRTVQNIEGRIIWLTSLNDEDLLCSFDGSGVSILNNTNKHMASQIIDNLDYDHFSSETYSSLDSEIYNSMTIGRKYFLFLKGRTVIVDLQLGAKTYYMEESVRGGVELHNQTIVIKDGATSGTYDAYTYLGDNAIRRNLNLLTKDFSNGSMVSEKAYRKMSVNGSGKWAISVYIDSVNIFSFDYSNGQTIHLPSGSHGKIISFRITSDGYAQIKAISYSYTINKNGFTTVKK